ncbi:MAG: aspartate aminotransferase family protein, partial [Betaproteobacteria bacterium]
RRLGYPIPPFDFEVEGVTSMSADLHKYGFAAKGASVMLLSDLALRKYLVFEFDNWPRGKYAAPTFTGTRPGGAIAAAWAVMRYLGIDGYKRLAREMMRARDKMSNGIAAIDGLYVVGEPDLTVMGYGSHAIDTFALAEQMTKKGWFVSTMSQPPGIHMGMPTMAHVGVVDEYLADLADSVATVKSEKLIGKSREVSYGG